jgi:hypothetical protein
MGSGNEVPFNPKNAFKIMWILKINLIFDTLNVIFINQSIHALIQSHMDNLYKFIELIKLFFNVRIVLFNSLISHQEFFDVPSNSLPS